MKNHPGLKSGIWEAVTGAAAISVIGFQHSDGRSAAPPSRWRQSELKRRSSACSLRSVSSNYIDRVQQGFVIEPAIDHREGRLGNDAGNRHSPKLGGCFRLRRRAWEPPVGVRTGRRDHGGPLNGYGRATIRWSKATYTGEEHGETEERAVNRRDRRPCRRADPRTPHYAGPNPEAARRNDRCNLLEFNRSSQQQCAPIS